MRFPRRGVEGRWLGLNSSTQELQADVLAESERTRPIDSWSRLPEGIRFVVIGGRHQKRLDLGGQLGLSLTRHDHVQQARCRGLPELLRDEHTLRTTGLEGHAQ